MQKMCQGEEGGVPTGICVCKLAMKLDVCEHTLAQRLLNTQCSVKETVSARRGDGGT